MSIQIDQKLLFILKKLKKGFIVFDDVDSNIEI